LDTVRPATEADFAAIDRVYRESGFGNDVLTEIRYARDALRGEIFVAIAAGRVVGASSCVPFGKHTGWLGGVAVSPAYRRRGIGSALTHAAQKWLRARGVQTTFLLATELGRPIYERLGFQKEEDYAFFTIPDNRPVLGPAQYVRVGRTEDLPAVLSIDREATGEDRSLLLGTYWPRGCLVSEVDGAIQGFHARSDWEVGGATVSRSKAAGLELLDTVVQQNQLIRWIPVPIADPEVVSALRIRGYVESARTQRMRHGPPVSRCAAHVLMAFNFYWG
jgi:predicted N-acetyltransferase YhbS